MEASVETRKPSFVRDWLLTVDHKKIGIMYGIACLLFFFVGGACALIIRTELLRPGCRISLSHLISLTRCLRCMAPL